jgi:hypothetical protein
MPNSQSVNLVKGRMHRDNPVEHQDWERIEAGSITPARGEIPSENRFCVKTPANGPRVARCDGYHLDREVALPPVGRSRLSANASEEE